jgi:uncharacterized repeat protein (TIGR03803 family)
MQGKKCLRTLASAPIIATAALALSGAATAASSYKIIHQFQVPQQPIDSLTMDAAGNLYGTTLFGGDPACTFPPGGCGVVWKLGPNGILTILHKFTSTDGANPQGGVIFDPDGNLYGTTAVGGLNECSGLGSPLGCGIVFKLAPNPDGTWAETILHEFTGADGLSPRGLIFDQAGNLYGATGGGGANNDGVVFKLAPNPEGPWTVSVLHSFTGPDGENPEARLVFDAAGNLDGTTESGGLNECSELGSNLGCGVVFKLAPNPDGSWTESVLHAFTGGEDGWNPDAGLIVDAAGDLYGTTVGGGAYGPGVVFKLESNPDGIWTETVLYSFTGGADGANPYAGLAFDSAGNLYGTTYAGGGTSACTHFGEPHGSCGVVFKLTPTSSGWSETVLWKFLGVIAANPFAPVIFDPKGNLYGTTRYGTGNKGVVFKITP